MSLEKTSMLSWISWKKTQDLDRQFESLVSDVSMELQKYLLFQLHHSKILSYKLLVRTLVSLCLVYPY